MSEQNINDIELYNSTIGFLEEAKKSINAKDASGKNLYLDRAFSGINELRANLKFYADEKLVQSLNQLYLFMTKKISEASLENDLRAIETIIELLTGLREAMSESIKITDG